MTGPVSYTHLDVYKRQFLLGVGQVLTQVQGTNPAERMQAVAREILDVQAELLSLQEVDQWYTGTFDPIAGTCGTMTLQYDMLQELLSGLAARGGHYEVAVQVTQNAFPPTPGLIPPADYVCVALTDYNVVLARTDLPSWVFQWSCLLYTSFGGLFHAQPAKESQLHHLTFPFIERSERIQRVV